MRKRVFNGKVAQADGARLNPAEPSRPAQKLGAMTLQKGLAVQAAQSFPQQFVRLIGHRDSGSLSWVRPQGRSLVKRLGQKTPAG